jgi:hypothetical protein
MSGAHGLGRGDRQMRSARPKTAGGVRRGCAMAAVLLAVVLAASGCSQPGAGGRRGPSPASPGSSAGKVPTGTQLGSLLMDAQLPSGWQQAAIDTEQDSGPVNYQVPSGPPATTCDTLDSATNSLELIGWWSVSDAALIITSTTPPPVLAFTPQMNLTVGGYLPGDYISRTLSLAASLAGRCGSFTNNQGDSNTITTGTVPQISGHSFYMNSTSQTPNGPIADQVLVAQVGNYLIGVDTNSALDGAVSQATLEQMGAWLARLVRSG